MFNQNSGYVGSSRSIRSNQAIDNYEVPLNMINKSLVKNFLKENNGNFTNEELEYLQHLSIAKWKYTATQKTHSTSWHHTSSYFNKTNHYDLADIADTILEIKDTLDNDYKEYLSTLKKEKEETKQNFKYGVIHVQVWGGTAKRPKLIGYDDVAGIIIDNWFFYKDGHSISKYSTSANKVETLERYNSYAELVKNHKEYKNTKKIFNTILSEKIK